MAIHQYPQGWKDDDWCVPTQTGNAIIKHGHTDPRDHSRCGPVLFCCTRAARLYAKMFPDMPECKGDWQLISASSIINWLIGGVQAVFFVYCNEEDEGLLALGMVGEDLPKIIRKERPLSEFRSGAESLDMTPKDDVIFQLLSEREGQED